MSSTVYLNATEQLQIVTTWSQKPGGLTIHLTTSGNYVYGNGKPVIEKGQFSWLPTVDREAAQAWFVQKFGDVKKISDTGETFAEPLQLPTEPDLDAEAEAVPDEVE